MRIEPESTVAVVIDIQEKLFPHIDGHQALEKNCQILINGLNELDIPIIVTEQYRKGLGPTLQSLQTLFTEFEPIEKLSFSCCGNGNFLDALREHGKRNTIICGIETHVCVQQTVIDLVERGYQPVVIEDCVSSRRKHDKEIAIRRMLREGAIITSYEAILFELCKVAGTEQFKTISKLVK